jgi:hypothetical protein
MNFQDLCPENCTRIEPSTDTEGAGRDPALD